MEENSLSKIITFDVNFWSNTLANFTGSILAWSVIGILTAGLIKPLRKWLYKQSPKLANILLPLIDFLVSPTFLLVLFFILQTMIFFNMYTYIAILATSVIFLVSRKSNIVSINTSPSISSQFSDEFYKLSDINSNWYTITGAPALDTEKGNPRPSLKPNFLNPSEATNTFLIAKKVKGKRGVIECDMFLNQGAVLNVVFLCNKEDHNWHMARYDSRDNNTDGFVIKDKGKGVNWRLNNMSTKRTNHGTWYKIKIEFSSERARMFRDGELIEEITNPQIFGEHIGLFNECAEVSVDNFKYSAL